jgi:hypothetical protein
MNSEPDRQGHMYGPDAIETLDTVNIFYLTLVININFCFI